MTDDPSSWRSSSPVPCCQGHQEVHFSLVCSYELLQIRLKSTVNVGGLPQEEECSPEGPSPSTLHHLFSLDITTICFCYPPAGQIAPLSQRTKCSHLYVLQPRPGHSLLLLMAQEYCVLIMTCSLLNNVAASTNTVRKIMDKYIFKLAPICRPNTARQTRKINEIVTKYWRICLGETDLVLYEHLGMTSGL